MVDVRYLEILTDDALAMGEVRSRLEQAINPFPAFRVHRAAREATPGAGQPHIRFVHQRGGLQAVP